MNALLDPTRSFGRLVLRAEDLLVQGGGQAAVLVAVGLSFGLALFEAGGLSGRPDPAAAPVRRAGPSAPPSDRQAGMPSCDSASAGAR
jgi:hypothetical protein